MNERIAWVLRQKGVIEILLYMHRNPTARYADLKKVIKSESTLIRVVNILLNEGIVEKRVLNEKYRPTEYTLTDKGRIIAENLDRIFSSDMV